jgi:hypothetical protein
VSPRYNRRRSTGDPELGPGAFGGPEQVVEWAGQEWVARRISGSASTKAYRCPGCDQEIRPATPHVVAWPVDAALGRREGLEDRRHWHSACWDARERRHRR